MNNTATQNREALARQVVRALDSGVKIVDSIAKKDDKWRAMVRPADEMVSELYAYAEQCKREDEENGE